MNATNRETESSCFDHECHSLDFAPKRTRLRLTPFPRFPYFETSPAFGPADCGQKAVVSLNPQRYPQQKHTGNQQERESNSKRKPTPQGNNTLLLQLPAPANPASKVELLVAILKTKKPKRRRMAAKPTKVGSPFWFLRPLPCTRQSPRCRSSPSPRWGVCPGASPPEMG